MEGKVSLGKYLIWVMILLGQIHGYKSCIEKERKALLELKKYMISITEEGTGYVLPNWTNDTRSDCCHWEGLKCNRTSGRVTEISFGGRYLKEGSLLNLSLLHPFEEVQRLDLSLSIYGSRGFSGLFDDVEATSYRHLHSLPTWIEFIYTVTCIPSPRGLCLPRFSFAGYKSLQRLRNLEILDLSWNEFNNSIFPFLNAATSLTTLFLRYNYMDASFPTKELIVFSNLTLLDLSGNKFNGSIPLRELSALRKLKALDLSENEFSGSLELQGICKLKNLQELNLRQNKLVGQFPLCLTSLSGLRVLDLSSNHLTGNVPSAIGSLESLEYLSLIDNNFDGLFSFGVLTNLSKLKVFKFGSNSNSLQVESKSSWKPKFELLVIALRSCNLEKVPHFLLLQKDLRQVDLSNNNISGIFPSWLLSNNTKLEVLLLQDNSFTSFQLPESAHNLRYLNVSVNEFNHQLPENIGWILPELRYMNISKNGFEGNLPSSMGNMKSINYLDISHNNFYGKLPRSIVNGCYSLVILKLSHNKLSGESFPESTNFTHVSLLAMDNNQFTGKIGEGLRNLKYLQLLDISNNNLTGVIPSWIGELNTLVALLISNNMLEGEIPISLFKKAGPALLDLSANILSGGIPPRVNSEIPVALFLQDNKLSGVIPDTLLENVKVLDLRNNRLSGNIPEFTNTQNIRVLLLQGNNLTGCIPRQLCGLRNIQLLDLSNNRLNGYIPSCLSNTSFGLGKEDPSYSFYSETFYMVVNGETYVQSLLMLDPFSIAYEAGNHIKIEFATKHRYDTYMGGNLELLFGMDLSGNELSGEILVELGGLLELQALNLSHNKLSGMIPESFSGLKKVESLDLSFNKLQGRIPPQLTNLSSLAVFNVSYNNLSGAIPRGSQFNTFDTRSYFGNPLLCGEPTNISCNGNNFQEPDSGVNNDEWPIDMLSFYWSFVAAYVTILLGIFASLSFDSPWSRTWFYVVDAFVHKVRNLLC